jgi:type VI secretion system protein ImpC
MPGRIEFEFTTRSKGARGPRSESSPMRILVLGDFSGHGLNGGSEDRPALSQRKLLPVDLDNLDPALGRIAPEVTLSLDASRAAHISFSEIDDFHPDTLFSRMPLFDELRDLRTRLHHRDTYPEAAIQLRNMLSLQSPTMPAGEPATPVTDAGAVENDAATFERLMGKPASDSTQAEKTARSAVDRLIGAAVKEHIVPEADAGQQVYFDAADQALGELMRRILHHPGFQALESIWRSVPFLISRLELDEDLQLVLLDVTKDELMEDARQAGTELEQTELYRLLIEQGVQVPGTDPWSLIIGQYCFDNSADDTRLLAMLGNVAAHAGGPFLAEASATLLGCDSLARTPNPRDWTAEDSDDRQRWNALRASPVASWIGLALPRLLLRLPYGENTDEIDSFVFQEVTDASVHEQFLWGNPAVGCAALIGQAFAERGWQMNPGDVADIGDLPAYSYHADGEQQILPCAEVYLTETAADKILAQGLMPMVSLRNTNTVRLLRFQSIAEPPAALSGPWDG